MWQKFWAIPFFPQKREELYMNKASLVLLGSWHTLENRIAANYKINKTEKSEKSVGCDFLQGKCMLGSSEISLLGYAKAVPAASENWW